MTISKSVVNGYRSAGTTTPDPTTQPLSSEVAAAVGSASQPSSDISGRGNRF